MEKGDIGSEVVGNLSCIAYAVGCLRFARSVHDPERIDNTVIPAPTWYLGHVDCFAIGDLKYSAFTLSPGTEAWKVYSCVRVSLGPKLPAIHCGSGPEQFNPQLQHQYLACPRTSVDRGSNSINSEAAHAGESALGAVERLANVIFIFEFTLLRSTPFEIV